MLGREHPWLLKHKASSVSTRVASKLGVGVEKFTWSNVKSELLLNFYFSVRTPRAASAFDIWEELLDPSR